MVKSTRSFVCQSCGAVTSKWSGKCDSCNEWNSIIEEISDAVPKGMSAKQKGNVLPLETLQNENKESPPRLKTGIEEFDRVTGGGLVTGSAILVGGDPGIGKSTILLQSVCALAKRGNACVYISGEEAVDQIRMRAQRLSIADAPVQLAAATNVRDIVASMKDRDNKVDVLIIDSIQTMYVDNIESAPGTVTQVRTAALEIIRTAKRHGICVIFVGHVTKEGQIAGPRVLEHMVDCVLYFEGDRSHQFRILRGVKNRFGPTDEIGVFEMTSDGLAEVDNPSALFLSQRQSNVPGSAVLAGLEGRRPVLVEVQALVAPSGLATPRRAVIGWDNNRLAMILAVMEARCGVRFSGSDIYLNIAGGIRIQEPAADLAVAAALVSAVAQLPIPGETIFFGEIGLSGEIRPVPQPAVRLKESAKLGFETAYVPKTKQGKGKKPAAPEGMGVCEIAHVQDIIDLFKEDIKAADLREAS